MPIRWIITVLMLAFAGPALAQIETNIDPEAKGHLEATASYLGEAQRLAVHVETRTVVQGLNVDHDVSGTLELAIEHPNRLRIDHREGDRRQLVIVDGDHHYEYMSTTNRYTRNPAPPSIRALFEQDPIATGPAGTIIAQQRPLLQPLLSLRGLEYFIETFLLEADYRGEQDVDGRPHHHLRLRIGDKYHPHDHLHWEMPIDLWIAVGDEPLPTRLEFDLAPMVGRQMREPAEARITVRLRDWRINETFDDEALFAFTPPDEAELVDTIFDAPSGTDGFEELLGEPAPTFELELLDGGTMDLADHLEQEQIVILDFWATWCGPCIQAMPDLLAIQEQYADQDVILYAINQQEPPGHVRRFVQQQGWDLRVPMDADASVARKYQVRGLPQTVLIGPDGTVQSVHLGFSANMKQRLESEIEQLLAGESLVD